MQRFVDINLMRQHLDDKSVDQGRNANQDLTWSDTELLEALEAVTREYNSLPPFIGGRCDPSRLPADTNMFLDGAGSIAIERWLRRKQRERTAFTAGGIETDPDKTLIDEMGRLAEGMRQRFIEAARTHKGNQNMLAAYRRVG